MLSLSKILFTAAIIAIVWYGFKFFANKAASRAAQPKAGRDKRAPIAHDMEKCRYCGVYHADGDAHLCEK
ncbi:MAG: hypothetical protein ABID63_05460 [Pseudomonadota bacterium]